ncbi:M20 family metallo-hydrolase [uncultured Desulfovibrio sp.]|uniref:M20 family metallo-hydrolase n=1 Tax=uncultured Desulfovibrio sp. TaxID=167968 RepID=UPI0026067D48|nr:M20 family metallo-hydrolase [uncultured Desulfovibrio sp.]
MSLSLQPLIGVLAERADRVVVLQQALTACRALGPENGGQGEEDKTLFIAAQLQAAGVTDLRRLDAPDPRVSCGHRPNLVARIPGRSPRTLWLFAHTDVVPSGPAEEWLSDPWQVRRDGDLLYGRGVEDNQQGLVSMLLLAEALHITGLTPDLTLGLVFMADEETGNDYGLAHILAAAPELFRHDDLFIVPDSGSPSGADIEVAEKSIAQFRVRTRGLQGHASTPHKARNALTAAAAAVTSLSELGRDFPQEDPLFDPPCSTFAPTRHDGNGPGVNIIPGEDVFYLDCRLLPGIDPDAVLTAARRRVDIVARHHGVDIDVELIHLQKASASAPNCPAAQALAAAVQEIYGVEARPVGIGGGTVAALLRQAGLPAVVWSCIRNTCHQHNEYSSISATIRDAQVFAHVLMQCR